MCFRSGSTNTSPARAAPAQATLQHGLPVQAEEEFLVLAGQAADHGLPIATERGTYIRWSTDMGAELWVQTVHDGNAAGPNPHFSGDAKMRVRLEGRVEHPEAPALDGAFYGWANPGGAEPGGGDYPFMFDAPDYDLYRGLELPVVAEVQPSAFTHDLEAFADDEVHHAWPRVGGAWVAESFIPSGLFEPGVEAIDPPRAHAIFAGRVLSTALLTEPATGVRFHWAKVRTLDGEVDVVADPRVPSGALVEGGVVFVVLALGAPTGTRREPSPGFLDAPVPRLTLPGERTPHRGAAECRRPGQPGPRGAPAARREEEGPRGPTRGVAGGPKEKGPDAPYPLPSSRASFLVNKPDGGWDRKENAMSEGTYGGTQPYQGADGLWHAQGADGLLYTYTQDANGFWYTQDASGNQLLWTGSGWADVNSGEAAQAVADHLSGLLPQYQPPTGVYGTYTDQVAAQLAATGDSASINNAETLQDLEGVMGEAWQDPDGDLVTNSTDPEPYDPGVQDSWDSGASDAF